MAWIFDEYSKFHGHSPAVVTGKPIVSICDKKPSIYDLDLCKPLKSRNKICNCCFLFFGLIYIWAFRLLVVPSVGRLQLVEVLFSQLKLYLRNMGSQSRV